METLPWELIGQIGGFLAPKYRCRLYLCRKLWYVECYLATYDFFQVCKCMHYVLVDIRKIKYFIYSYYADNIKYQLSEITKINRIPVYAESFYSDHTLGNKHLILAIYNGKNRYRIIDYLYSTVAYKSDEIDRRDAMYDYKSCEVNAMNHNIRTNNILCYNIFICMKVLKNYMHKDDILNISIALGKDIYNMCKTYLDVQRYYNTEN
jgi:hypothetical protein